MIDHSGSLRDQGMTRGEVAYRLRLSPERVAQLGRAGVLPFLMTPLGRLYEADAVEAFAEQRERLQRGGDS